MDFRAVATMTRHDRTAVIPVILSPQLDRDQPRLRRFNIGEIDSVRGFRGGLESHAREARDVRGVERNPYRIRYARGEITNAHARGLRLAIAEPGRIGHLQIDRSARGVGVRLGLSEDSE